MAVRKIIEIDRDKCDGCGLCTTACAEGALELDAENKAVLVREIYCDGLGACLDVCPTGALKVVERESGEYDPSAAYDHVLRTRGVEAARCVHGADGGPGQPLAGRVGRAHGGHGGCPGSLARDIPRAPGPANPGPDPGAESRLSQWPIQLHLISPLAPYFEASDLLIAADCTAFALGGFHDELLAGKKLVIACPKLDDTGGYVDKLAELIRRNRLSSLTVAVMTVPCCTGLDRLVRLAVEKSGVPLEVRKVVVGIDGTIVQRA
ncbi:MAG: 4Fe-4S dicluster domain-containing protein [Candidatus Aminicenantes bacterium]|nr:4Fe-4S dicluster domain-containing protein [Candidatus Aminicenantes bacterium]